MARMRAGIWRIAAVSTARWSAKVFEPALPGRSSIARLSAVLAHQAPSGWKPSLNYAIRVARLGCRTRSRRLHGCSRPVAADVEDRQRGEAGQVVKRRMSAFCGDQAGDMAATAWRTGYSGHPTICRGDGWAS